MPKPGRATLNAMAPHLGHAGVGVGFPGAGSPGAVSCGCDLHAHTQAALHAACYSLSKHSAFPALISTWGLHWLGSHF